MKKRKAISIFLILSILLNCLPVYALERKTTIAVYEIEAQGVDENLTATLTDVLRDAIFQTGKFEMLTRKDMEQILNNLAERQKITSDCDTDTCIAEIAGALGVGMMITGNIGKFTTVPTFRVNDIVNWREY